MDKVIDRSNILDMDLESVSFYLKSRKVEESTYNKVRDLYLLQNNSFDRVLVFTALIELLKGDK